MSSLCARLSCAARLSVFLLLALSGTLTLAQNPSPDQKQVPQPDQQTGPSQPVRRPRIGLALSGGGALGLAEIGVIQWLEQNHIPVDRVAGTSLGSICLLYTSRCV